MAIWQMDCSARQIAAVTAAGVALSAFAFVGYRLLFPPPRTQVVEHQAMAYFYDLNTGETFTAPASSAGPLNTETGPFNGHPAGVRAHVYACGSCDDPEKRFVAWLEIPISVLAAAQPEYEQYLKRDNTQGEVASTMVRQPDDEKWVPTDSPEALEIFEQIDQSCTAAEGVYRCRPPSRPKK